MRLLHPKNDRGVALLIVLLVTALLIALVFEFSYATRISLNSAANFRDSQRAYFLALSGINAFKTKGAELRDYTVAGEWSPVPLIEGVLFKWEDESGKIKINDVKSYPGAKYMVPQLFENKEIDAAVFRRLKETSEVNTITLLTGLREYMSDEDFEKVRNSLTVSNVTHDKININTASSDVLQSMGISADQAEIIIKERRTNPYTAADLTTSGSNRLTMISEVKIDNVYVFSYLTVQSAGYYKVYASAEVGGYTKTIEAILNGSTVHYWKEL